MTEPEKLARWEVIYSWLLVIGCCGVCSLGISLAAVERESGAQETPVGERGCGREARSCRRRRNRADESLRCLELAKKQWGSRPKKEPAKAAINYFGPKAGILPTETKTKNEGNGS